MIYIHSISGRDLYARLLNEAASYFTTDSWMPYIICRAKKTHSGERYIAIKSNFLEPWENLINNVFA